MCYNIVILGFKRKRAKSEISTELVTILNEMDEKAEERELKRMKLEAELEEKRRVEERKHEERMQTMMMGFMTQMMSMVSGGVPPPSFPHSHQPSTSYIPSPVSPYQPASPFDPQSQAYSTNILPPNSYPPTTQ